MKTKLKSILRPLAFIALILGLSSFLEAHAQTTSVVKVTGVRFTYPLIENWIDQYQKLNPDVQIIIEYRGMQDPSQYDILIEAYDLPEEIKKTRDFTYVGRYVILPVANSMSAFARAYATKGLTQQAIKQVFFHDLYADKDQEEKLLASYTTYTRMQKASAPIAFARYFKYEQKDLTGKGIAGSDEHLLKAVLRDTTAVTYLSSPLVYDRQTGAPVAGITPIPVDINDNGRVSDEEKFYGSWSAISTRLAQAGPKDVRNLPIENIHLSVDKKTSNKEAIAFIRWVAENGLKDLKAFGYLSPETTRPQP